MLYAGDAIGDGEVRLVAPRADGVAAAETGEVDDWGEWSRWFVAAHRDSGIIYFSVERNGELVGEFFLHDINWAGREAMVGYRVFDRQQRCMGIGTQALAALVSWAARGGDLDRLIVIARGDNPASRRLAERAGFTYLGAAREDSDRVVYERSLGPVTGCVT